MAGLSPKDFYGPNARGHPPTLTSTERKRFTHSYYWLWCLMEMDMSEWDSKLQEMTSRELYYLHEMTYLTQRIGTEETTHQPAASYQPAPLARTLNFDRSEKRESLSERIWQRIKSNSWRFYELPAQNVSNFSRHEGFLGFVAIWDHWQPFLEDVILQSYLETHREVVSVLRATDIVEKAIEQFEREIVKFVRVDEADAWEFYEPEVGYNPRVDNHPPNLTSSERKRFIHCYYSIWSLMRLDETEWDSRLDAMTSQELHYLLEMSQLGQNIGGEETARPMRAGEKLSKLYTSKEFRIPEKRFNLEHRINQQIDLHNSRFFEDPPIHVSWMAKHLGFAPFVAIWDHAQLHLEEAVCQTRRSWVRPSPMVRKRYLWDDDLYE
ncbi:MAG: hypothetical protein Q9174_004226 [Haloplaca sp. 1 TL-2023]